MTATLLGRFAPYAFLLGIALYWPLLLYADAQAGTMAQQHLLGLLTFALLFAATRFSSREERRQVWLLVVIATGVELVLSVGLGLYSYRWDNVPLFVPPGHGLIFLFALRAARTPLVQGARRVVVGSALVAGCLWVAAGLTVIPLLGGRLDVFGLFVLPMFVWFLRRPPAAMCAAAFFVISELELIGTALGNWTWAETTPVMHLPAGNPPAVVAAGYCVIEIAALRLATAGIGLPRLRPRVPAPVHVAPRD